MRISVGWISTALAATLACSGCDTSPAPPAKPVADPFYSEADVAAHPWLYIGVQPRLTSDQKYIRAYEITNRSNVSMSNVTYACYHVRLDGSVREKTGATWNIALSPFNGTVIDLDRREPVAAEVMVVNCRATNAVAVRPYVPPAKDS